jgi:hypothetical protein
LQSHRVFFIVKAQMSLNAAMTQCTRGDHLGIEQGVLSQQTVKEPAMAVSPIHHGGNGQAPGVSLGERCLVHALMIINK